MLFLTKIVDFSSSHRLYNPNWSDEKNFEVYNKCSNKNGHGHNYKLEVTIKGEPDQEKGFIIDLKEMKNIINEEIVDKVDHQNLNLDVDFLKGTIPTVENLVVVFWNVLDNKFPNAELHRIRIYETDTSFVDYYGN